MRKEDSKGERKSKGEKEDEKTNREMKRLETDTFTRRQRTDGWREGKQKTDLKIQEKGKEQDKSGGERLKS